VKHLIALNALLVTTLGLVLLALGEADDSPGLGGLGLLLALTAVALGVHGWRAESRPESRPAAG